MVDGRSILQQTAQSPDSIGQGEEAFVKGLVERELGGEGFLEARFETTFAESSRVVRLVAGRRYTLDRIVIEGAAPVAARARLSLERLAGDPWDAATVRRRLLDLLRAHEDEGYPFAELAVRHVEADSATASVKVRIGVSPGTRAVIEGVEVPDTIRTKSRVVARLAGIRPGSLYRQRLVEEAVSRLRETRYFTLVGEPTLTRGRPPDGFLLRIPLAERQTHHARGALGFSRGGAVVGSIEATLRNIAGTAREAAFSWNGRGEGRTDLGLAYREPWILGLPPSLDVEVRQVVEDTLWVEREGEVGMTWDLGAGFTGSIGYQGRRVIPGSSGDISGLRSDEAWGRAIWDRETAEDLPPRGHWIGLRAGYRDLLDLETGIKTPVVRLELEARRTVVYSARVLFLFRGAGKLAIHGGDELPLPERFAVGGARSVRGYREAQFRTDRIGWFTVEAHLSSRGLSSIFLFGDIGAYRSGGAYRDLCGFGPGITARTTLGVANLAYGIPRGSDLLQGRIHVALGGDF
jgi:outer membrane protein assembly factor BamA